MTVHYEQKDGAVIPKRVHTIVISVQHDDYISLEEQKKVLKEKVRRHGDADVILVSYRSHPCEFNVDAVVAGDQSRRSR